MLVSLLQKLLNFFSGTKSQATKKAVAVRLLPQMCCFWCKARTWRTLEEGVVCVQCNTFFEYPPSEKTP